MIKQETYCFLDISQETLGIDLFQFPNGVLKLEFLYFYLFKFNNQISINTKCNSLSS